MARSSSRNTKKHHRSVLDVVKDEGSHVVSFVVDLVNVSLGFVDSRFWSNSAIPALSNSSCLSFTTLNNRENEYNFSMNSV